MHCLSHWKFYLNTLSVETLLPWWTLGSLFWGYFGWLNVIKIKIFWSMKKFKASSWYIFAINNHSLSSITITILYFTIMPIIILPIKVIKICRSFWQSWKHHHPNSLPDFSQTYKTAPRKRYILSPSPSSHYGNHIKRKVPYHHQNLIIIKILSSSDCICRLSSTYLACRAPPRLAMRWRSWRDRFSYYSSSKYPSSKYSSSKYSSSKYPSSKNPSSKNFSSKYCGEVGGTGSRIIPPQNIPPQNIPPQNIPHQNIPPQNIVEKLEEQFLILSLLSCSHITRQVLSYFVNCHI